MKKAINKAIRIKLHVCLAEQGMVLSDYAITMGISFDEAKSVFYGYKGSENDSYVPGAHYEQALKWLEENYVE
ncbi:hypothetical protein [Weissella tructae]